MDTELPIALLGQGIVIQIEHLEDKANHETTIPILGVNLARNQAVSDGSQAWSLWPQEF